MEFEFDTRQIASLIGAALVLIAFMMNTFERLDSKSFAYGALNCIGTAILAYTVWSPLNLGLLIVEIIWSTVSLWICIKAFQRSSVS